MSCVLISYVSPGWQAFASTPVQEPQKSSSRKMVDFEDQEPGLFQSLSTALGDWKVEAGQAKIDSKHAKTGKHCLQLMGGTQSSIILNIRRDLKPAGILSFWAERWTARQPFKFRIDQSDGKGWKELYNGDRHIKVGRSFLSHIKIPLNDQKVRRMRFTVSSPPDTGILIDDLQIAPPRPQKIVSARVIPVTLPALVRNENCYLTKLVVQTDGNQDPLSVSSIEGQVNGGEQILQLRWVQRNAQKRQQLKLPPRDDLVQSWPLQPLALSEGENEFWIACQLKPNANIDQQVGAVIKQIQFSNGKIVKPSGSSNPQRTGVAVRRGGDDRVHTYRIPGLVTTKKGTLIGVYDVRHRGGRDLPGDIDVGMSRSTDKGQTWEPLKIIMDMGRDSQWHYDGIGDPAILVDQNTGTIWVAATWSHGNRSWRGSGPGLTPDETGQLMLVRSDDDGQSWSKPINITKQIKRPEWCFILQGPGKGITMRDGTLVFAAQYQDPPGKNRLPHSTIIYSKDHGQTWKVGKGAFDDTTEAQVVEIEPGTLMLNCRYNRKSARVVMTTTDMGQTWQKHPTSEKALIEPGACMASLIDVNRETGKLGSGWLLFSNPDSLQGRRRITIKASKDQGKSWPDQFRLLLDQETSAGYSCLTMIDENTIGILYEGSQAHMAFQRIPLQAVIGQKRPKPDAASQLNHRE